MAFAHVKANHPYEIDAIVVLPEHLHCVLTLSKALASCYSPVGRVPPGDPPNQMGNIIIRGNQVNRFRLTALVNF
jgi:hypothetical protein